jgi:rod shape-determining protein MreD
VNFFALLLAVFALILQLKLSLPFLVFSPLLALLSLQNTLPKALWLSLLLGLLIDLFSAEPFGLHALVYTLSSFLLYRFRRFFSLEKVPLFTLPFSLLITLMILPASFLFDRPIPLSFLTLLTDFFLLPIGDCLFAFLVYSGPIALYRHLETQWRHFWLNRTPSPS